VLLRATSSPTSRAARRHGRAGLPRAHRCLDLGTRIPMHIAPLDECVQVSAAKTNRSRRPRPLAIAARHPSAPPPRTVFPNICFMSETHPGAVTSAMPIAQRLLAWVRRTSDKVVGDSRSAL
jgi:hypothetical protein